MDTLEAGEDLADVRGARRRRARASVIEDDDDEDYDEQQAGEHEEGDSIAETSGGSQGAADATNSAVAEIARPRFIIRIPVPPFEDTEDEEEEEADEGDGSTRRSKRRRVAR